MTNNEKLINRPEYIKKLNQWKNQEDLVKIITGVRRCGKSKLFVLFQNELLKEDNRIIDVQWATMIKYKKRMFYLTHFYAVAKTPRDGENKQGIIVLHGHTHQTTNFTNDNYMQYGFKKKNSSQEDTYKEDSLG